MEIVLSPEALEHIEYWKRTNNVAVQERIKALKNAIIVSPYQGIGKPELLKNELTGKWSRRIDRKNRFVYAIENDTLYIYSLKDHY
ncbi:MAG: Txe/YoeB family addiction module toxin [Bacteroidales bacterium]|jgi:toxin YoeB|nr:Txe/YoeB family addiction module toxin [Bacteroidales bacterium]